MHEYTVQNFPSNFYSAMWRKKTDMSGNRTNYPKIGCMREKRSRANILSALERRGKGQARATDTALHIERHRMVLTILLSLSLVSRTQHDRSCAKYAHTRTMHEIRAPRTPFGHKRYAPERTQQIERHKSEKNYNCHRIKWHAVRRASRDKAQRPRRWLRIVSSGKLCEKCTLLVALGR